MQNQKPSKEELLQYWYDTDLDTVCKLYHLKEEDVKRIVGLLPKDKQYFYNTVNYNQLSSQSKQIAEIIAKHYKKLYRKYTTYQKDTVYMSQTNEDLFQMAIIRTMETELPEVTTETVLQQLHIKFCTLKKYNMLQYYNMKNKVLPLELKAEDGEYVIPAELFKNAIPKETTETAD